LFICLSVSLSVYFSFEYIKSNVAQLHELKIGTEKKERKEGRKKERKKERKKDRKKE
jgi:hypothetical protein